MADEEQAKVEASRSSGFRWLIYVVLGAAAMLGGYVAWSYLYFGGAIRFPFPKDDARVTLWWDDVPQTIREASLDTGTFSNIRRADYVGPETCKKCHEENYESWSGHPHRWMNALADETTVLGDFSGRASIHYLGGTARFYRTDDQNRMELQRGPVRREYGITQTIGSRFFQYYIGVQLEGPEGVDHPFYHDEHVLPFGYWLTQKQWVPTVHLGPELPDGKRPDPFDPPEGSPFFANYAKNCSHCHSTYPDGERIIHKTTTASLHVPRKLHFQVSSYLQENRPDLWNGLQDVGDLTKRDVVSLFQQFGNIKDVRKHAVTFGISCEACHYGARQHAENESENPRFFPSSPHLFIEPESEDVSWGRSHANVNWVCGRCHAGGRPQYANGISTWNSTEFSDASRGGCYSELTCIKCHDPHQATGLVWTKTPAQDDAVCLECHQQYEPLEARTAHTHHPIESEGSGCLNCHMPRLNEGMQDIVRTHTIFSPTQREMIEDNQPNACNMCHTDQSIDFTLQHLAQWYGATYSDQQTAAAYPKRDQPAPLGWIQSNNEAVRLVAADVLFRSKSKWALPWLVRALNDPFLINRQFATKGLQEMFEIRLEDYGYRYYMEPEERLPLLEPILNELRRKSGSREPSVTLQLQ